MATKPKIKFVDNALIRKEIDDLYENTNQVLLAIWSISMAKHILEILDIDYRNIDEITEGFKVNESWQSGNARMHDVRQSGFKVHKLARDTENEIHMTAFRVVGQAVGSGHMREHAMVASDYAIKVIGMIHGNDIDVISKERNWQLEELKRIVSCHTN